MNKKAKLIKVVGLGLALAFGMTACKNDAKTESSESDQIETVDNSSDGETAGALIHLHKIAISLSDIGRNKAQTEKIRTWAEDMNRDFMGLADKSSYIIQENKIKTQQSDLMKRMEEEMNRFSEVLRESPDEEFDRNYTRAVTRLMRSNLETMEKDILPKTENRELQEIMRYTLELCKRNFDVAYDLTGGNVDQNRNELRKR